VALSIAATLTACARGGDGGAPAKPRAEMPVALNTDSPFQYPPDLFDQGVEGEVRLRLFVDAQGRVVAESTRIASTSGTPGLDSAAVRGAAALRFAPARRDGTPVSLAFYQPVVFRRLAAPQGSPAP
jgi:protein TonB